MAKPKKTKQPADPREISDRRAQRREMESRGLEVNVDPRNQEILGAWRPDCFTLLLKGRPEEASAVQWLETLIRTAAGENGGERRPDFIRGSCEGAPGQNVSQIMIEADRILSVVQTAMPPHQLRMLFDLMKPDEALVTRWRIVVARCTGEVNPHAQAAAVRAACSTLVWVQANLSTLRKLERIAA